MMLFVSEPFKSNLILTYFAGVVGATFLELVTGVVIEAIFKVRYWDYSNQKFNYRGYICLSSSVVWGFFTIGMNEVLHPEVNHILHLIAKPVIAGGMSVVTVLFVIDIAISVKEALDLRNMLMYMEDMRKELLLLRRRADVVIACLDDSWREFAKTHPGVERLEEVYKGMELQVNKLKKGLLSLDKLTEGQKAELKELKERFLSAKEKHRKLQLRNVKLYKGRISGNPSMISKKYKLSLDTLKEWLKEE